MPLSELTSRAAVEAALNEFDQLGRTAFLKKYHFGRAHKYFVKRDAKLYDSKAIAGAARGFEHPEKGPLPASDFQGGEHGAKARLQQLGFDVVLKPGKGNAMSEASPIHLVVKWSARYGSDTVERHRAVLNKHGAV